MPSPKMAHRLADALGVEPEEILPNLLEEAIEEELPALEMREAHGVPGKVWIRMNRLVNFGTAAKIFALIEEEK